MINTLGLTQGLAAAGQDYNSAYMNALGTVYSRNLAQQKQTSESNLQNSQADYYSGKNQGALQVADARRQGMIDAYKIRAQGQTDVATINNLKFLPTFEQATAGQTPEVAAQNAGIFDQKFGTNLRSLFAAGGSSAGGSGVPPTLPPPGGLNAPSPGGFGGSLSGLSGSGLSGLGGMTPPGVSPTLPPLSGPTGNPPPALAAPLGSGVLPSLPPPSDPSGSQPPAPANSGATIPSLPPLKNPFSPSPLAVSQINKNNASANGALSKTDMLFQNSVGLLPTSQQAQATARFNQISGTNYAVPGVRNPTLPDGTPVLGPPTLTPPYTPNAMQAATIAGKNAQTNAIGENYGLKVQQFKRLQDYQNALVGAKQQEISLQQQGLSEKTAHDRVMANIAQQGVNARGSSLGGGGNGVAGDALTARLNQRMTQLTTPGKLDFMGKPSSPPLVTLDAQGNPTGPGAAEYQSLQGMMRSRFRGTAPVNPVGGGFGIIPGAGKLVQGISAPSAGPLPALPPRSLGAGASDMLTINGRTATRAQWAAEMAKPGRR